MGSAQAMQINPRMRADSVAPMARGISASENPPTQLVIITDPGQDLDDEMGFIMLRFLVEQQLVEIKAIVATLAPAFDRARLCRGTLDTLGLFGVPIGVGTDGGDINGTHKASTFVDWARPYMPPRFSAHSASFEPARRLLYRTYKSAQDNSLSLVVIASMKDAALFLRDCEDLFKAKTKEVIIMGGVKPWEPQEDGSKPTMLEPDTAHNNMFDMEAAIYLYRRCQEIGVPLVILSRWSAYAAKVPRSTYDELASTGSWIGCRLRNAQRYSIESLWARACAPAGSPDRKGLPERCERTWFLKTFCGEAEAIGREASDTIWDLVIGFMQYDTLAIIAALPGLRTRFFNPHSVTGPEQTTNLVIGRTEEDHNVSDPEGLAALLASGFRTGLALNHRQKVQFILLSQPREQNRIEELLAMTVLRSLFELGVFDCAGIIISPGPGHEPNPPTGVGSCNDLAEGLVKTLSLLGLAHVPVLISGTEAGSTGVDHLKELYGKVSPAGVSLVATGSLGDAADFADMHSDLFKQKTQKVILVGGGFALPEMSEAGEPTGNVVLEPDPAAQNNKSDMPSAKRFFRSAQNLLVPLVIVSRHFAKAVQIPRSIFDLLESHGGDVGKVLRQTSKTCIQNLWEAAGASEESKRGSLPVRCDRNWFLKTFCSGDAPSDESDVWSSIESLNAYSLLAVLVALPPVFDMFVAGTPTTVRSVTHITIGSTSAEHGVKDADTLRKLIFQCLLMGTQLNSSTFNHSLPPPIPLSADGQNMWQYVSSKEALDWLLPMETDEEFREGINMTTLLPQA